MSRQSFSFRRLGLLTLFFAIAILPPEANAAPRAAAAPWITLTPSSNPSQWSQAVTFTGSVGGGGSTPSGTVDFYETTSPTAPSRAPRSTLASQPLVGGQATFTASSLTVGTHNMQGQYSGDGNYNASNSVLYPQQVEYDAGLNLFLPWIVK